MNLGAAHESRMLHVAAMMVGFGLHRTGSGTFAKHGLEVASSTRSGALAAVNAAAMVACCAEGTHGMCIKACLHCAAPGCAGYSTGCGNTWQC